MHYEINLSTSVALNAIVYLRRIGQYTELPMF